MGADVGAAAAVEDLAAEVIRLPVDPADPGWFAGVRARLLAARDRRPQPGRDDIVVLRSNGLAIAALAEAGAAAARTDWVDAAVAAAEYLLAVHRVDGRWYRSSRDGRVGPGRAVLADHGDLAGGLLALYQATGDRRWLDEGVAVIDQALAHFAERERCRRCVGDGRQPGTGGFFDTADDAGPLIVRPRDPTDGAAPSGQSAITNALLTAAALTGDARLPRLRGGVAGVGRRTGRPVPAVRGLAPVRCRGGGRRPAAGGGGRATRARRATRWPPWRGVMRPAGSVIDVGAARRARPGTARRRGRRSAARRPPTSAAASSAIGPSPPRRTSRRC